MLSGILSAALMSLRRAVITHYSKAYGKILSSVLSYSLFRWISFRISIFWHRMALVRVENDHTANS